MTELLSHMAYALASVVIAKMVCDTLQIWLIQREHFVIAREELGKLKGTIAELHTTIAELEVSTAKTESLREDINKLILASGMKLNR
jgi:BMFP domain-containing protein YqiC